MKATFRQARICAVIGAVPARVSRFDDELCNYTHDAANSLKLKEVMGYGEHRVARPGLTTADLAKAAFLELVSRSVVKPEEVAALFVVTQTPDYVIPATSSVLHGALGLPQDAYCIDINDGCNGYVKGLFEALSFLQVTQSACAVVIAGDVLSPLVSRRDRNSFPLVGDAATVSVVRRDSTGEGDEIVTAIRNDGTGFDKLIVPAGGARQPLRGDEVDALDDEGNWRSPRNLRMNGRDVFAFTQTVVPAFLLDFCKQIERSPAAFDRLYLHQANAFIIDRLRKKLGVSAEQMPDRVVRRYGNSSSGTIPMLIASEPEDHAALQTLLCGFGVGLSWGAVSTMLQEGVSQGILEVE